ncbi:MAG TPA: hypothetical protein VEX15_01990 [Nocardioidaceae bacterium]|nr:hypothetical protein [Nocardioidaceae bacterium]
MPLDLVLHIGSGKTGTSSIQTFMHRNRERLADLGHLYPKTPGVTRHIRLGLYIRPDDTLDDYIGWHRQRASSPQAFRKSFRRRLFREINESGLSRVLFSDEALYGSSSESLRRLSRFTHRIAGSLRVVVYLRRQDDHFVSRYQQVVKVGETRRLTEWAAELDHASTYDYHARLRMWERLLDPDEFVVRRFESSSFVDGSLLQDFFEAVRIDARAEDLTQSPIRNIRLDAETVEFFRLYNLHRVENEGARVGLIDNRKLVTRMAEVARGPALTLPASVLDSFMAQWEEGNQALTRRYLRDATGELFRMPRRTDDTTTEQHLDPARIDHFVSLLELPQEVHAPLRRMAEREAKVR